MTYSIVARDPLTGALGVGVQTHQPAVGAIVPWIEPGVGAVATQAMVNPMFGPQGLALLRSGMAPDRVVAALVAGDEAPGIRQFAVLAAHGLVATHTGDGTIPFAGHRCGQGYSVQANMMLRDTVPAAMATAFEASTGHLALRILAALDAAEGEGGDIRGRQSAALRIRTEGDGTGFTWDLRCDNDPEPLLKLRQLVAIRLAAERWQSALDVDGTTDERVNRAESAFAAAQELSASDEQLFWFAVRGLTGLGAEVRAAALLAPLFARAPQWQELLDRLPGREYEALRRHFRS